MLAFSNDYYGFIFRVTQSVELFCTYDYSTSEMVKLCGMKASSTFENKRDKVFERYEIDPTLFKMDSM